MKRAIAVLVIALVVSITGIAWGQTVQDGATHHPLSRSCTAQAFRGFSEAVWDPKIKREGNPPRSVLEAHRKRLGCAPPGHRKAMKKIWHQDRANFLLHRKIEPHYGCTVAKCDWWAIPAWSVNCESKGGLAADNLYENLITYRPGMSKWEQSVAAYKLMQEYGGGWAGYEQVFLQWETGCEGYPG